MLLSEPALPVTIPAPAPQVPHKVTLPVSEFPPVVLLEMSVWATVALLVFETLTTVVLFVAAFTVAPEPVLVITTLLSAAATVTTFAKTKAAEAKVAIVFFIMYVSPPFRVDCIND
jgi:hypothetical protein